jgi:hypothetical protein
MMVVNNFVWYRFFSNSYYSVLQMMAFFNLCVWILPIVFLISLTVNEETLPMSSNRGGMQSGQPGRAQSRGFKLNLKKFFDFFRMNPASGLPSMRQDAFPAPGSDPASPAPASSFNQAPQYPARPQPAPIGAQGAFHRPAYNKRMD